ncbi:MAG: amidohydrolase family protein [Lachnospiraceae bacterium]|nr:amidohydrolase family protein [Lachnospiraceae bacterium]
MTVDFHTHIFPDKIASRTIEKLEKIANVKAFTDGREESLIASMNEAEVDLSVVLPVVTRPEQFDTINNFAVRLNEKYQGKKKRLLSFGGIHPDTLDYKRELRVIKDLGLIGIKLHPDYQNTYMDDIKYMRILDYASELGLINVIHAGVDIGFPNHVRCTPERIRRVIDEVAPEKMVLAHYGSFGLWEETEALLAGENVYFDTAYTFGFIEDETFLRILKRHGADKILFATDSPWSGQKESLAHLKNLAISAEDLDKITGQNAIRLLSKCAAAY